MVCPLTSFFNLNKKLNYENYLSTFNVVSAIYVSFFIQLSWLDAQLKEMWEKASDEVKSAYGQDYFDAIFTGTKAAAKEAAKSVSPVIDAMEDAVVNVTPSIRYLVDGSIRLVDYNNVS